MKNAHILGLLVKILLIVGGLNWGLVGLFKFDLVASIFGEMTGFTRIIYVLVGLAAVYKLVMWIKDSSK
jgi:uncharacterized membrane protein YuzA (DUF378 family)